MANEVKSAVDALAIAASIEITIIENGFFDLFAGYPKEAEPTFQ